LYRGCIEVEGAADELGILFRVLYPEKQGSPRYKSRVAIKLEGGVLKICIKSRTISSFRAAMNTFLRILSMLFAIEQ